MRHWILAETNYGHVREQGYDVDIFSYDSPISRNGKLADPE